jgi:hypothetical protein
MLFCSIQETTTTNSHPWQGGRGMNCIVCTGKYVPEEKMKDVKCKMYECAAGLGLAGRGVCFLFGNPFSTNCSKFKSNEDMEREP